MSERGDLAAESAAFDARIEERVAAGLVPDLRRAVKCDYFYKSFWRDPHFLRLHLGTKVAGFLAMLANHAGPRQRILDVGCGPGVISLELARAGHHVVGIDVSTSAVRVARETLASNPFREGFGSLEYRVLPFMEAKGSYDVVLFSGAIHHFRDPKAVVLKATTLLPPRGLLLCGEPCHEEWRLEDAAQVALIRILLSMTGFWYEPLGDELYGNPERLLGYMREVYTEYVEEHDKDEPAQSPNDNACLGKEILAALLDRFDEVERQPSCSFIYRLLGGMRGPDEVIHALADFLNAYDRLGTRQGFLRPSGFYFLGRKKPVG
jgi:2-polyprenyl-6-hydroxyphenyl methylase/3-demethylubiquinone-9 3-methyltransferase